MPISDPRSLTPTFLITGNMGYIGPVLARALSHQYPAARLIGFDSGFFAHCLTTSGPLPETLFDVQAFGDTREPPPDLFQGVDAVIHLAAVSNDPMGNRFEKVTEDINQNAGLRLAKMARAAGARHFVFASSCSVYGAGSDTPRKESDPLNPLTAYARSKVGTEKALAELADEHFTVTCLRFATACGLSPRLRLDLVLNDFVASALATGEITILSDGTPWRPLIDVADMARALAWAAHRDATKGGPFCIVNVGANAANVQVRALAAAVAKALPATRVTINPDAAPDKRSYRVDFGLFEKLAPEAQPQKTLSASIDALIEGLRALNFADVAFRQGPLMRLKTLEGHIAHKRLNEDLRWIAAPF
jgi:nucleoside-diphosphate-sugar epimerase